MISMPTNNDTSDDTYTLVGYAVGPSMTLADGQTMSNVSLAMVTSPLQNLAVTFPAAPPGLAGWTIPVEPLLATLRSLPDFAPVLEQLRHRAR